MPVVYGWNIGTVFIRSATVVLVSLGHVVMFTVHHVYKICMDVLYLNVNMVN